MDYMPSDAFRRTLEELDNQLNGGTRLAKNLASLEAGMDHLRQRADADGASHNYSMDHIRKELDDVKRELRALRSGGVTEDHLHQVMSDVWARMDEDDAARKPPDPIAEANKSLMKSVVSFLSESPTRAEVEEKTLWVYKSFGRSGGQRITYNKELAGRLLMTKSISPQEHENWKKYNRLPDDVTSQSQGRAQAAADRAMLTAYAMASLNISPLAAAHMLRRR